MKKYQIVTWKQISPWLIILSVIPAWYIIGVGVRVILAGAAALILGFGFSIEEAQLSNPLLFEVFMMVGNLIASIIAVWIYWVKIQKNNFLSIGFYTDKVVLKEVGAGFLTGIIIITVTFLLLVFLNQIEVVKIQFQLMSILIPFLYFGFVVGFTEELIYRGYLLGSILKLTNKYFALIIVAIIFSVAHFVFHSFSLIPLINLFLAGILLGIVYIHTHRLWFPISLHFIWNFLLGPVFGSPVSENQMEYSIVEINFVGSKYLTGGDFGFEGSVIMTVLMIVLIFSLDRMYKIKTLTLKEIE